MKLEIVAEAGSTQAALIARAEAGEAEGALMARRQNAGRGRLGRSWVSAEGNLHLSVLLRPGPVRFPGHWSLMAGVALHEALAWPGVRLKWPNDLLLGEAKVAGVLVDAGPGWMVLGFGVNLVWAPEGLGRPVAALGAGAASPEMLAPRVLGSLHAWRRRYDAEGFAPVRTAWLRAGPPQEAGFPDIAEDGALLLPQHGGVLRQVGGPA